MRLKYFYISVICCISDANTILLRVRQLVADANITGLDHLFAILNAPAQTAPQKAQAVPKCPGLSGHGGVVMRTSPRQYKARVVYSNSGGRQSTAAAGSARQLAQEVPSCSSGPGAPASKLKVSLASVFTESQKAEIKKEVKKEKTKKDKKSKKHPKASSVAVKELSSNASDSDSLSASSCNVDANQKRPGDKKFYASSMAPPRAAATAASRVIPEVCKLTPELNSADILHSTRDFTGMGGKSPAPAVHDMRPASVGQFVKYTVATGHGMKQGKSSTMVRPTNDPRISNNSRTLNVPSRQHPGESSSDEDLPAFSFTTGKLTYKAMQSNSSQSDKKNEKKRKKQVVKSEPKSPNVKRRKISIERNYYFFLSKITLLTF